mgnify:CR=1 FL=1
MALIAVALGVAGTGIFLALRSPIKDQAADPSPTATASPAVSQTTGTITALGRLEPESRIIRVAAPSTMGTARVARLLVKEGGPVKVNQVIAVMDVSDRLLASAIQAEAQVREAQSRLAQVRAGAKRGDIEAQEADVARLNVEVQIANREYQRYQELYRNGAVSASELDSRRLRAETTVKQLEQARQRLSSVAEIRPTDIQQAEAQVQVAVANLQRARADLETALVRSPIDGQVIKIHAYPGEQVGNSFGNSSSSQSCNCIAELGKTNQMYAVAEVYETDVARVRPGQKATITSSALPGEISGTVDQVGLQIRKNDVLNTDPAADTDARVVEVRIRLDDSKSVAGLTNLQVNVAIQP